jgi:hypothetical protein
MSALFLCLNNVRIAYPLASDATATLESIDWFHNRHMLGLIGDIPPVELHRPGHDIVVCPAVAAGLN